jgi:hypothetical protein
MTQAFNLAQLANNLNTSGQLDGTDGLSGLVANANLASSGTASSGTFLRGDRTWSSIGAVGKVLQYQYYGFPTQWSGGSAGWANVTGFSGSITPNATSSRIMVLWSLGAVSCGSNSIIFRILRNGTPVLVANADGSRVTASFRGFRVVNSDHATSQSFTGLDSPASTSALTYQLQFWTEGGNTGVINRNVNYVNSGEPYDSVAHSSLSLIEIGA